MAPFVTFYKDWRDEVRRKQIYVWSYLFDSLSEYLQVPREDVGYLTIKEIMNFLKKGGVDRGLIRQRSTNLILVTSKFGSTKPVVVDKVTPKYFRIFRSWNLIASPKKVTGLAASSGKIQGKVRLILTGVDLRRVKKGEVLIANTTHPNYLPAMREASAIVTNEGGIICHAAITARELKKPCIVGTKIATKVFKDGDLVEVDANKGIVRKI